MHVRKVTNNRKNLSSRESITKETSWQTCSLRERSWSWRASHTSRFPVHEESGALCGLQANHVF